VNQLAVVENFEVNRVAPSFCWDFELVSGSMFFFVDGTDLHVVNDIDPDQNSVISTLGNRYA
jgi:hypothetical protein